MKESNIIWNHNKSPLISYVNTQMNSFHETPFGEVDALVFAQISYLRLDQLVNGMEGGSTPISDLYQFQEFEYMMEPTYFPEANKNLICGICGNPRFRNVEMMFHVDKLDKEREEQFSATSFLLPTGEMVISFRGTDSNLVGWKEDLNMTFLFPVPSQISAMSYVKKVAKLTDTPLILTGHSKGGSLAAYSYCFASASVKHRVRKVYNFDGPGFPQDIIEQEGYQQDKEKIIKLMPEGSMVGIFLERSDDARLIKSNAHGLMQHNLFSWKIEKNQFIRASSISLNAKYTDKTINQWVYQLSLEQRKTFIEAIFSIMHAVNIEHTSQILPQLIKERKKVQDILHTMDVEIADCVKEALKRLALLSMTGSFSKQEE